jgi:hypothetical protein
MKKIVFLLTLCLGFVFVQAQDKTINMSPTMTGVNGTFFGAAKDTVTANAVKTYVFLITAPFNLDGYVQLNSTKVSGAPAYTAKIEESLDGVTYFAITNVAAVTKNSGTNYSLFWITAAASSGAQISGKYVKVTVTATGAAQKSTLLGQYRFVQKFSHP